VIITLCGTAASAFENAIVKAVSAGALMAPGEKAKFLASTARIGGAAEGLIVGAGVGLGFGVGVGLGFGVGVGLGVALGVGFGVGPWVVGTGVVVDEGAAVDDGAAVATAWRLGGGSVGGAPDGGAVAAGSVDGGDAVIAGDGTETRSLGEAATGDARVLELTVGAPQAIARSPMATNRGSRTVDTAAL
jgi:hypothetical protein